MRQLKLPEFRPKQSLTVQIDSELLNRVRAETKKRSVTLREAVEYGLRSYLEVCQRVGAWDAPKDRK